MREQCSTIVTPMSKTSIRLHGLLQGFRSSFNNTFQHMASRLCISTVTARSPSLFRLSKNRLQRESSMYGSKLQLALRLSPPPIASHSTVHKLTLLGKLVKSSE